MKSPGECKIALEDYCRSCRCFMTGEYCSKQENIRKERKLLHNKHCINVFVIMNFSSMSDVVFKWRLQGFIESLSKYFRFETTHGKNRMLVCCEEVINSNPKVKLNIVRSDSNPSSNYVMCSRICQQLQIADLVVVDVSQRNTNVFYELGIAVALGKLILPICYSESFFKMEIPEKAKLEKVDYEKLICHIDCFPWRRTLFEYYGIRFRNYDRRARETEENKETEQSTENGSYARTPAIRDKVIYRPFEEVIKADNGYSDEQYNQFPYDAEIAADTATKKVGVSLYDALSKSYNDAGCNHNTLIVYTMDGLLNEEQAGLCIVNYYRNITQQMKLQQCFYGDRVGVLIQGNTISEKEKDARRNRSLIYSIGEIIHIGMNQATYTSQMAQIKSSDYLNVPVVDDEIDEDSKKEINRFVKEYSRNKSISIYPDHPVYVERVEKGIQYDLFDKDDNSDKDTWDKHFFCLYHIMLQNLKCTNEVVVDISGNSIHALFWLGAAHGSDVYTIAVRHEQTEEEQTESTSEAIRPIFDISGLWTAILHSYDTEGFYQQLAQVQMGIDQHTKLMVRNPGDNEDFFRETMHEKTFSKITRVFNMMVLIRDKEEEESAILESYYRSRFWKNMLRYNRLLIFLPQKANGDSQGLFVNKDHVDILAKISRYLSRRTVIGEYDVEIMPEDRILTEDCNYISIGDARNHPKAADKPERKGELYRHRNHTDKWNARAYFHVVLKTIDGLENQNLLDALIAEPWETGSIAKTNLIDMQFEKRNKFIKQFHKALKRKFRDVGLKFPKTITDVRYVTRCIQYASEAYLSTVLYRYFLPFLTIEEENRILNGMETYMRTLLIVNRNSFSWGREIPADLAKDEIIESVRTALADVLAVTISDEVSFASEAWEETVI